MDWEVGHDHWEPGFAFDEVYFSEPAYFIHFPELQFPHRK